MNFVTLFAADDRQTGSMYKINNYAKSAVQLKMQHFGSNRIIKWTDPRAKPTIF
jgi:hypothetical protein